MLGAAQEGVRLLLEGFDADPRVGGQDARRQGPHIGVVPRVVLSHVARTRELIEQTSALTATPVITPNG
jgi:hypothetical protein